MRLLRSLALLLSMLAPGAVENLSAQSIDPRSYVNTPVGINFLVASYAYTWGNVLFDPTVPISNAEITAQGPALGFARALDFWGLSGKANLAAPFACVDGSGEVNGVIEARDVCGFGDFAANVSINFLGAPALSLSEYPNYRQGLLMGGGLLVTVPVGQYDARKLVNVGTHRWSFRPQIGVSQALGRLTLEFLGAVSFYTTNGDFFGGHVRKQAPLYSGQVNVIYTFRSGIWGAVGGTLYGGGRATVDGVPSQEIEKNWRLGAVLVFPVNRQNSIRLGGTTGLYTRTGSDFNFLSASWIYAWGGRKLPKSRPS